METLDASTGSAPAIDQAKSQNHGVEDYPSTGHRSLQLLRRRDFFVPVSQREKPANHGLLGVASAPMDGKLEKKKGRPKKGPVDDGARADCPPLPSSRRGKRKGSRDNSGVSDLTTVAVPEYNVEDPDIVSRIWLENSAVHSGAVLDNGNEQPAVIADETEDALSLKELRKVEVKEGERHASAHVEADEPTSGMRCSGANAEKSKRKNRTLRRLGDFGSSVGRPEEANCHSSQRSPDVLKGRQGSRRSQRKTGFNKDPEVGDCTRDTSSKPSTVFDASVPQLEQGVHANSGAASVDAMRKQTTVETYSGLQADGISLKESVCSKMESETQVKNDRQDETSLVEDHQPAGDSCDEFFIPLSKRRKRNNDLKTLNACELRDAGTKLPCKKDGQARHVLKKDKSQVGAVSGKDKISSAVGSKAPSLPDNLVLTSQHFLRMEAIMAAQENARLNAGKATHPFFSRKNLAPKTVIQDSESSTFEFEDLYPGPPIHVTQSDAINGGVKPDELAEVACLDSRGHAFGRTSNIVPGNVFTLQSQRPTHLLQQPLPSKSVKHEQWRNCSVSFPGLMERSTIDTQSTDDQGVNVKSTLTTLLQHLESMKDWEPTENIAQANAEPLDGAQRSRRAFSLENLKQKLNWYVARHRGQTIPEDDSSTPLDGEANYATRNILWTDLYQPKTSEEVCGNADAVDGLRNWLLNWQDRITGNHARRKDVQEESSVSSDSDGDWFEDNSDTETDGEEDVGVSNTLLICGPEGCGKSAAIYACAAEQGFEVIEVNASDSRHGSVIKSKFGEAMKSHTLGKSRQAGPDSPQPVRGRGQKEQGLAIVEQKTATRQARAGKQIDKDAHMDSNQTRPASTKEETSMEVQTKGRTLVLFEDVEKRFEEDKGFVHSLVELASMTRRPIILTSNRRQPGLPGVLEKFRIDFDDPASGDLLLHSSLVCIAERVPCSTRVVESLVHSCQKDLRKIMMALQFWGQGKETPGHGKSGSSNEPTFSRAKAPFCHVPCNESDICDHVHGPLDHWGRSIRWLFELGVHHLLLPKLVGESVHCPLSACIADKIQTAVCKKENDNAQDAARGAEARAYKQEAKLAKRRLRKAVRTTKGAARVATPSKSSVIEDSPSVSFTTPIADEKREDCGSTYSSTPSTGIRGARAIARSPSRRKAMRSRRALLLGDSDDEEPSKQQPAKCIDSGNNHTISDSETVLPCAGKTSSQSLENVAEEVGESLDDVNTSGFRNRVAESIRTTSISQGASEGGGSPTCGTGLVNSFPESRPVFNIENLDVNIVSEHSTRLDESKCDRDAHEAGNWSETLSGIRAEESRGNYVVDDESNQLILNSNRFLSGHDEATPTLEGGILLAKQMFCKEEEKAEGVNHPEFRSVLQTVDSKTRSNSHDSLLQSQALTKCSPVKDTTLTSQEVLQHISVVGQSEGLRTENQDSRRESTCAERAGHESDDVKPGSVVHPRVIGDDERAACDASDPVRAAWENLQGYQRKEFAAMVDDQFRLGADGLCDLADLVDVISVSDVIAGAQIEEPNDTWGRLDKSEFLTFEDNVGCFVDWEGCQEMASHLAFVRLQHSLRFFRPAEGLERIPVLACILESARDPSAVGKCMISKIDQMTDLDKAIGGFESAISTRQAHNQARLEGLVDSVVRPKGRMSSSALIDYWAFLSRISMSQLEEARKTHGKAAEGRRPKRLCTI